MRLSGLVTIVTGAASGLGAATARRFAAEGAHVVLSDFNAEAGARLADQLGASFCRADVTSEADIAALVDFAVARHGALDCMINNAGQLGAVGGIARIAEADWTRTIAILLDSVFFGMKHAARAMEGGRGGCILSTASVGGIAPLAPHAYTAAKFGVVGLTQSVASELAGQQIRVNAVAPGKVPTAMTTGYFGGLDEMRKAAAASNPLGTVAEADEIAGAFAYLASPDGRNITGQVLTVDAGITICRHGADYYRREPGYQGAAA